MTVWFPSWRSLNLWNVHFPIPVPKLDYYSHTCRVSWQRGQAAMTPSTAPGQWGCPELQIWYHYCRLWTDMLQNIVQCTHMISFAYFLVSLQFLYIYIYIYIVYDCRWDVWLFDVWYTTSIHCQVFYLGPLVFLSGSWKKNTSCRDWRRENSRKQFRTNSGLTLWCKWVVYMGGIQHQTNPQIGESF